MASKISRNYLPIFRALMECHLDAGRKTDASSVAGAAATFIKQNVPHLYKQVFGLIVSPIILSPNIYLLIDKLTFMFSLYV